jgi:hypothetical protein
MKDVGCDSDPPYILNSAYIYGGFADLLRIPNIHGA